MPDGTDRCEFGGGPNRPILVEGAFCRCDETRHECVREVVEPVACKTDHDCSWVREPLRPVPAKRVPRPVPAPVRPCETSEKDSQCYKGFCRIAAWSC